MCIQCIVQMLYRVAWALSSFWWILLCQALASTCWTQKPRLRCFDWHQQWKLSFPLLSLAIKKSINVSPTMDCWSDSIALLTIVFDEWILTLSWFQEAESNCAKNWFNNRVLPYTGYCIAAYLHRLHCAPHQPSTSAPNFFGEPTTTGNPAAGPKSLLHLAGRRFCRQRDSLLPTHNCIRPPLHMAFAKTQKRIRSAVFSVYLKIGLKLESYKNYRISFSAQWHISAWAADSGIESRSTAWLPITRALTNKPNTQVRECYLVMYIKPFRSAEWWTLISQWSKFDFPIFLLPKPKVSIYSVSVY